VALYPGTEKSEELVTVYKDGVLELAVPLRRRCAMVRLLKESQ